MNAAAIVMRRMPEPSPRFLARMAGVFWLLTILAGTLALFPGFAGAANLIATGCYLAAIVFVYELLKPVHRDLSLVAALFGVMGCAIGTFGGFLHLGRVGQSVQFAYFGLHCFLVGCLILRSTFMPRAVGGLMLFAGLGWMTFSLLNLLSSPLARYLMAPGILGEASLSLWLLVMGVNVERWHESARKKRGAP